MTTPPGFDTGRRTWWSGASGLAVLIGAVALWGPDLMAGENRAETLDPITRFLLAVAVILAACHLLGALMRRCGQPAVLGEMLGGLLLGPSAIGLVWPSAGSWLFPTDVLNALDKAAQLGLVVFMFLLGGELRIHRIERPRLLVAAVLGGAGIPFVAGLGVALATGGLIADPTASSLTFTLFIGLALAITALPVLARIIGDLSLEDSQVGVLALSAAAIGDALAWLMLAVVLATTGSDSGGVLRTAGLATALVLVVVLLVRHLLRALLEFVRSEQLLTVILVVGAITFAALTQLIDLHPLIGAFLFGVAVPRDSPVMSQVNRHLQGFTLIILLPLFFAGIGLITSIGLLGMQLNHWLAFAAILVTAQVSKIAGAGGGVRLAGLPGRKALQFGVLMNCRGVTELVIAAVGLRSGIINQLGFTILVLVALITTATTSPLMRYLLRTDIASLTAINTGRNDRGLS